MEKSLPRVFANPIDKPLNNNEDVFYSGKRDARSYDREDVLKKVNEIFASKNHVYKSNVRITTLNDVIDVVIVGKMGNSLLTLEGNRININEILSIEKL